MKMHHFIIITMSAVLSCSEANLECPGCNSMTGRIAARSNNEHTILSFSQQEYQQIRKEHMVQKMSRMLKGLPRVKLARGVTKRAAEAMFMQRRRRQDMSQDLLNELLRTQLCSVQELAREAVSNRTGVIIEQVRSCCLEQVEVDLHAIGWNHIIAPRTIKFNYCRGSCDPEVVLPSLFTDAASQLRYRLSTMDSLVMDQPCCSARHHAPMEVIFLDSTHSSLGTESGLEFYDVELVTIPDLMVTSCGCS